LQAVVAEGLVAVKVVHWAHKVRIQLQQLEGMEEIILETVAAVAAVAVGIILGAQVVL
jgi:hypothetical protein